MQRILETEDSKYILLKRIGLGGTCLVYKGYCLEDNSHKLYAIKIFKTQYKKYYEQEILVNKILPQKLFLSLIKHGIGHKYKEYKNAPNSIISKSNNEPNMPRKKFIKIVFYKIEELAENGELFSYVYKLNKGFTEHIGAKIFEKIVKSVKVLHEHNIVHCDIKPENILLNSDYNVKLMDFGFSQVINRNNNNIIYGNKGSEIYSSPEIRKSFISGYDGIKSDIFSLGVLLFVIIIGRFPFTSCDKSDGRYNLIINKNYNKYWVNYNNYNLSKEFKDLMNHMICYEPNERFSIDEILEHPWIQNNVNNNKSKKENKYNKENNYDEENNENKENDCNVDQDVLNELKKRRIFIQKKKN